MNHLEWPGFFLLTILDMVTAVMIFFCALNERILLMSVWYRVGLIVTALGFAAQGALNLPYLLFGTQLYANQIPFWALKDMGISMVATHYFWLVLRDKRKLGTPLEKDRAAKANKPKKPRVRKTPDPAVAPAGRKGTTTKIKS
ncbi:hypothetical protein [Rahnella sikkimica]|uniref:Uncharacterized protein n=1 Tax=Rahnella sikkimica TaxID=1805933 RepID=A0A2L1UUS3_9GAMM|nr:hypothetical protein [Rahnella sikkimica]AVF36712.1 hypothetical protein BV494_18075 [Rahnella sikkimica]